MKWIRLSLWSFVLLIASLTPIARAQISSYGVTKTGYYMQKSDAAPELENGENRSEEHTSELQSQSNLVCRLLLEKKKKTRHQNVSDTTQGMNVRLMSTR